jgi:hypothetical protein
LIGFLLFLCLTIFTAMVIPRDGGDSSSSSSRAAACWGDLVEMANMTVALRHEALAACFLLPPSAAAAEAGLLPEDGQQIPTSCPPNTSSSHAHHGIQIQVLMVRFLSFLCLHCLCPTFLNFDRQFNMLFFKKAQLMTELCIKW